MKITSGRFKYNDKKILSLHYISFRMTTSYIFKGSSEGWFGGKVAKPPLTTANILKRSVIPNARLTGHGQEERNLLIVTQTEVIKN